MKRKLLLTSIVIALLVSTLFLGSVSAYTTVTEGYFTYAIENGEAEVFKCDKSASGTVTIPDTTSGGYPVTSVKNVFYDCDNITSIVFGKNVKSIASWITNGSDNISSITMTDSVTSIGGYAFYNLDKLTGVILSRNITDMGKGVFQNCDNLQWVVLPDKITQIPGDTFSVCKNLQKVFIPKTVTQIGTYAFQNCESITDIYFEGSQTQWNNISIGSYDAGFLKNATIHYNTPARYTVSFNTNGGSPLPDSFSKIYGISAYLPSTRPTKIGYTFNGWNTKSNGSGTSYNPGGLYSANATVTLYAQWKPNTYTVNYYSNDASNQLITSTTHTYGVTRPLVANTYERSGYTFLGWNTSRNSTSVKYEDKANVTNLTSSNNGVINLYAVWKENTYTVSYDANGGENAPSSQSATAFSSVTLSSDIPVLEGKVFVGWSQNADSETAQYQPQDTFTLGSSDITLYAVWRDYAIIDSGTIPNYDNEIRWSLYENGKLHIEGSGHMNIGYDFGSAPWYQHKDKIIMVEVTDGVESIGYAAFYNCGNLASIALPDSIKFIDAWAFSNCKSLTGNINLKNVTSIDVAAFSNCENIEEITLGQNLNYIGNTAFSSCYGLTEVYIPASVTKLGVRAFGYNKNIVKFDVSAENPNYASVNGVLFNKNMTELITYPCKKAGEYKIPETVSLIHDSAFMYATGITGIEIPSNISTIDYSTFYGCSNMKTVTLNYNIKTIKTDAFFNCTDLTTYYQGSEQQWKLIEIQDGNTEVTSNVIFLIPKTNTVSENQETFMVSAENINIGETVILALYNNEKFIGLKTAIYKGEDLTFETDLPYTDAKVMVWNDGDSINPVTYVEKVK